MSKTSVSDSDLSRALDGMGLDDVDDVATKLTRTSQGEMWQGAARTLASAILAVMVEHSDSVQMSWGTFIDIAAACANQNASVWTVIETLFAVASSCDGSKSGAAWDRFKELVPDSATRSCVAIDLVCEARERGLHLATAA